MSRFPKTGTNFKTVGELGAITPNTVRFMAARLDQSEVLWWEQHANVIELGRYLIDEEGYDADELLQFFDAPYKWTPEWEQFQCFRETCAATA